MTTISTRQLIDANLKALEDRTLGAFYYPTCMYVYPGEKHFCAIGVAIPMEIIQGWDKNFVFWKINENSVEDLTRLTKLKFEHKWIAYYTQMLHDTWASRNNKYTDMEFLGLHPIPTSRMIPGALAKFLRGINGQRINEEVFRAWINLLDETYPKAPVAV